MKKRLLIVDDEESVRELFAEVFQKAGYAVKTARSAEEAMEIMKTNPYMLMILDLKLPGMSGVELCRKIKENWPMAVPVAVTGYASYFELSHCREAGFEDYFIKPVSMEELINSVEAAYHRLQRWRKGGR